MQRLHWRQRSTSAALPVSGLSCCRRRSHRHLRSLACASTNHPDIITRTGKQQWHEIKDTLWMGTELAAGEQPLSPLWKVFLLSDGSVTRHLQLLTGSKVKVDCLSMTNIGASLEGVPAAAQVIEGPRVQRQVLLRTGPGNDALVYACSWWNAQQVDEFLRDKSQPIWVSLSQGHVELYRDIQAVYRGNNSELEKLLGCEGPFWGRQYLFVHNQRPLTCIHEVFSPKLSRYLGQPEMYVHTEDPCVLI